jgi:UDP:flavonoid glycosyltransferase YjiC (YdhE family)
MKEILDSNENIIYFGLGTVNRLNKEEYEIFFKVFEEMNILVIFSLRKEFQKNLPSKIPKNIKIFEWVNQEYTLFHKNVKIFITHGNTFIFIYK